MSFRSPCPTARPVPLCSEMHVLLTLNDRGCWVLCSSVMGVLSSCSHVPCAPPAPTGAKRTLAASSGQPPNGPEPGGQPLKARTLSGMASKTTATVTPKRVAHSPSLQVSARPPGSPAAGTRAPGWPTPLCRVGAPRLPAPSAAFANRLPSPRAASVHRH